MLTGGAQYLGLSLRLDFWIIWMTLQLACLNWEAIEGEASSEMCFENEDD